MSKLPQVKPAELCSFLKKLGFADVRQVGSHIIFQHPDGRRTTVAIHNKPISIGTFLSILREINLKRDEFLKRFR